MQWSGNIADTDLSIYCLFTVPSSKTNSSQLNISFLDIMVVRIDWYLTHFRCIIKPEVHCKLIHFDTLEYFFVCLFVCLFDDYHESYVSTQIKKSRNWTSYIILFHCWENRWKLLGKCPGMKNKFHKPPSCCHVELFPDVHQNKRQVQIGWYYKFLTIT